jgi:hypothetical protein
VSRAAGVRRANGSLEDAALAGSIGVATMHGWRYRCPKYNRVERNRCSVASVCLEDVKKGDECAVRQSRVKCGAGWRFAHDTPIEVQMMATG